MRVDEAAVSAGAGGAGAPRVSLEHDGREREPHGAAARRSGPGRGPAGDLCLLREVRNNKALGAIFV